MLADLFNMCLKESCSPEVSSGVFVFKKVKKKYTAKNSHSVSLLSVIRLKNFEKLGSGRIVDHLEKCSLISNFQYGFRSSQSTADLLAVVSDVIVRIFIRSGATRAVAFDISKDVDRVWQACLPQKFNLTEN